jgi:hypothetical protein
MIAVNVLLTADPAADGDTLFFDNLIFVETHTGSEIQCAVDQLLVQAG